MADASNPLIVITQNDSMTSYSRLRELRLNGKTSDGVSHTDDVVKVLKVIKGGTEYIIFKAVTSIVANGTWYTSSDTATNVYLFRIYPYDATGLNISDFDFNFSSGSTILSASQVVTGSPTISEDGTYRFLCLSLKNISYYGALKITVQHIISGYSATTYIYYDDPSTGDGGSS